MPSEPIGPETVFKVLSHNRRSIYGGRAYWPHPNLTDPWVEVPGELRICKNALHLAVGSQVLNWLGPTLWVAKTEGETIDGGFKIAARKARLVRQVTQWNLETARRFTLDLAEMVLPIWESENPDYAVDPEYGWTPRGVLDLARNRDRSLAGMATRWLEVDCATEHSAAAIKAVEWACLYGDGNRTARFASKVARQAVKALRGYGLTKEAAQAMVFNHLCRYLNGPRPKTTIVTAAERAQRRRREAER